MTKSLSGPSTRKRSAVTSSRPRYQVTITKNRTKPIVRGSQAPWAILVRFDAKKPSSIVRKNAAPARVSQRGRCQRWRTMKKKRTLVTRIVPVTAVPYAKASLAEDWKARTSVSTATSSSRLITGT